MKMWECTVCSWPHEGDAPPNNCPRCGVPSDKFVEVDLEALGLEDYPLEFKELSEEDKKRISPAMYRISYGLYMVGSQKGEKINGQICNTVFQITNTPMRIAIGINKSNLTHEYIKESGIFTVSILGAEQMNLVGTFGFKSGREVNKFEKVAYKLGVTEAPILESCISFIECKVDPSLSIDMGTHTLFIGDVVEGGVKEGDPMTYALYRQMKNSGVKAGPPPKPLVSPAVEEKKEKTEKVWRCEVCGYEFKGEDPPNECPICGVSKDRFALVE